MGKLIYSMVTSLDGYVESEGGIGRGPAEDAEAHAFIGRRFEGVGTYLYGRRMYEVMVAWETMHLQEGVPPHILEYGEIWRAADKVVYSTTLEEVRSERTRIEREFDPEAIRRLKSETDHDISVNGPALAAQAIAAGLVDEYHLFLTTSAVGGGKRFFPDGVRLDLELVEHRSFPDSGLLYAYYRAA